MKQARNNSRQLVANRKKILNAFPTGFLPEEDWSGLLVGATDRFAITGLPFFWLKKFDRFAEVKETLNGEHESESPDPLLDLYLLEVDAAAAVASKKSKSIKVCADRLQTWFDEHVSPEGVFLAVPGATGRLVPPLFRFRTIFDKVCWSNRLESGFQDVVDCCFKMLSAKGWVFDEAGPLSAEFRNLLKKYSETSAGRDWYNVHRWIWGGAGKFKKRKAPEPSLQSDATTLAVLRRDWALQGTFFAVDYSSSQFRCAFQILGEEIFSGNWETQVTVNGDLVKPQGEWEATCWYADKDGDYFELAQEYGDGLTLERQIYMARSTQMLLTADTLKAEHECQLEVDWFLPECSKKPSIAKKTRAARLRDHDFNLKALPVGLPTDPKSPAYGRLEVDKRQLHARSVRRCQRLFLPLVWHWSPKAVNGQDDWRWLTVTNDRRLVPADEAIAFRVYLDDRQVVFFRAQEETRRYAFMGKQTLCECVIGEVDPDGDVWEWLMVE